MPALLSNIARLKDQPSATYNRPFIALVFAAMLSVAPHAKAEDTMTFQTLEGKWTGFGWFLFGLDTKERARCKALIVRDGSPQKGKIDIACKSESEAFDAGVYDVQLDGGNLTGQWSMRSHEVDGSLIGTMSADTLSARMIPVGEAKDGYGANMKAVLKDKCHATITISVDSPVDLNNIDVALRRC